MLKGLKTKRLLVITVSTSSLIVDVFQITHFFLNALCILEEYVKSGCNQMIIDSDLDEIFTKRKKEDYECCELQSLVITQHEILKRWLGKISRKDAFIHLHSLTGFPVKEENS